MSNGGGNGSAAGESGKIPSDLLSTVWNLPQGERVATLARLLLYVDDRHRGTLVDARVLEDMQKELDRLREERADYGDRLKRAESDGAKNKRLLDEERADNLQLRTELDNGNTRRVELQKRFDDAQVVLRQQNEELARVRQAAAIAAAPPDMRRFEQQIRDLQDKLVGAQRETEQVRASLEQAVTVRNQKIEELTRKLEAADPSARLPSDSASAETPAWLWERLKTCAAPVVRPDEPPSRKAVERAIQSYESMTEFVLTLDHLMHGLLKRPMLGDYIPELGDQLKSFLMKSVDDVMVDIAKPGGVQRLANRVRTLQMWSNALLSGGSATLEQATVVAILRGQWSGDDALRKRKMTIEEFSKGNGPELFARAMLEDRGTRIAKAFNDAIR